LETILKGKKHLESILDQLPDGIICHDRERRITFFNRAAEALTGYSRGEVLGRDCHEAFGRPFCGNQCSFCGQAPDSWTSINYPLNIVTKTGEPKQVQMAVVGLTDEGGRLLGAGQSR
jgi:PAS domain S-box-containing protein